MLRICPDDHTDADYCNEDDQPGIQLGDHEDSIPEGSARASSLFEALRQDNLKLGFPILMGNGAHQHVSWLDDVKTDDLPDAADAVLLAHAARMAIRAVARLEDRWRVAMGTTMEPGVPTLAAEPGFTDIMNERDRAAAFYLETRERLARIGHLESINERAKASPAPKVRLPRARRKKSSA